MTAGAAGDVRRMTVPLSALVHAVLVAAVVGVPILTSRELPKVGTGTILQPIVWGGASARPLALTGGGAPVGQARRSVSRVRLTLPTAKESVGPAEQSAGGGVGVGLEGLLPTGLGDGLCVSDCGEGGERDRGFAPPPLKPPVVGDEGPERARPVRVVREPRKLRYVEPIYPQVARLARLQGKVVLECTLATDGTVQDVAVVEGSPLLSPAAVSAVSEWRYVPTLVNGRPVSVSLTVTVFFRLS